MSMFEENQKERKFQVRILKYERQDMLHQTSMRCVLAVLHYCPFMGSISVLEV